MDINSTLKPDQPSPREYSDARYIFILFGLIFVVLFFAFLIYFIYGKNQGMSAVPADDPGFEKVAYETTTPQLEDIRKVSQSVIAPTDTPTKVVTNAPTDTRATSTTTPTTVPTIPTSVDLRRLNPRTTETLKLKGRDLLDRYFSALQTSDYQTACSLVSSTICNARRDVFAFSQFPNKTTNGYVVKSISLAPEQKPTESIYCIEYTYTLKADLNPQPVTEYFQYRIKTRPDGGDEISARVCEKVVKDGRERPCPIITPKKYCY